nr:GNAT family N-acetyltransferase [Actinomycetales bacterium]
MVSLRMLGHEPELVLEASMGTINWPGPRFTVEQAMANPELARYRDLRPERGDFGVVAEVDGVAIGLCWVLFLPEEEPGFGFVAVDVPEYAIWVRDGHRRRGLARRLTRAVVAEARCRGLPALSLSVEANNPSRFLYLAEGFVPVPGREDDGVMVLAL